MKDKLLAKLAQLFKRHVLEEIEEKSYLEDMAPSEEIRMLEEGDQEPQEVMINADVEEILNQALSEIVNDSTQRTNNSQGIRVYHSVERASIGEEGLAFIQEWEKIGILSPSLRESVINNLLRLPEVDLHAVKAMILAVIAFESEDKHHLPWLKNVFFDNQPNYVVH